MDRKPAEEDQVLVVGIAGVDVELGQVGADDAAAHLMRLRLDLRPAVAEAVAQVVQPDDVDLPCGYCALSGQDFPKPGRKLGSVDRLTQGRQPGGDRKSTRLNSSH